MFPFFSELLLVEEELGRFSTVLRLGEGHETHLPAVTPAEALVAASEIDYRDYRREVQRLWDEHPLFEEQLDIPVADLEDFVAEALLLPSMIRETDPVGFFVLGELLHQSLQMPDDGTATFLLNAGRDILRILEEPFQTQVRLRNILEVTFDGMERASQQERFAKLQKTYPHVAQYFDPALLAGVPEGGRVFSVYNLLGLRFLELALYFQQERQRISRCEYCWGYYIPKSKTATRYCDRVIDGFTCKKRGSRYQRNNKQEQDEALQICERLRDRMYGRFMRYEDAAPDARERLIQMGHEQYDAWSVNASLARREYVAGEISAEEFLRRIDTTHELTCYEAGKAELSVETRWQRMVARRWDFDPERHYPESFAYLNLSNEDAQWKIYTADELRRRDQQGHQSLREKYGKG